MQARQQAVEQATGPGPVGRRPEPVARLREKFVRHLDTRHVTEQDAMRVQRALGLAGGAGGEDHQRGIVRRHVGRRELIGRARDRLVQAERALARTVDREHQRELRQRRARFGELREPLRVGDDGFDAGVLQPIGQRIDSEQDRERHRDGADLVDRDVPGRGFRRLWQQHRDAVAARNAVRDQRIGKPVRGLAQPAERDLFGLAVRAHVEDREASSDPARPSGRTHRRRCCSARAPASGIRRKAFRSRGFAEA